MGLSEWGDLFWGAVRAIVGAFGDALVIFFGKSFVGSDGEGGIEEDEEVWFGADGSIVGIVVELVDHRGGSGEVTACGAAAGSDPVGVDAEFIGVGTDPAHCRFGVGDTVFDFDIVAGGNAVFGGNGDHPSIGEVFTLFLELAWAAGFPSSPEEEDDGGRLRIGGVTGRRVDIEGKFGSVDSLINSFLLRPFGSPRGCGWFFLSMCEMKAVGEGQ